MLTMLRNILCDGYGDRQHCRLSTFTFLFDTESETNPNGDGDGDGDGGGDGFGGHVKVFYRGGEIPPWGGFPYSLERCPQKRRRLFLYVIFTFFRNTHPLYTHIRWI